MSELVRASRRKYHIIYKTTCLVTGRYYIGMHSTDDLEDGYLGSGVRLTRSVKKYGRDQHVREILECLPTREAASDREKELITEDLRADPMCLNCGVGGLGAFPRPMDTEETKLKRSQAAKRMHAQLTDEQRANRSAAISSANKLALNTPETKAAQSAAARKRWEDPKYIEQMSEALHARKHSDEAKQKMAKAKLGKKLARTPEHNAKIAAAHKARWAKLKEQQ